MKAIKDAKYNMPDKIWNSLARNVQQLSNRECLTSFFDECHEFLTEADKVNHKQTLIISEALERKKRWHKVSFLKRYLLNLPKKPMQLIECARQRLSTANRT